MTRPRTVRMPIASKKPAVIPCSQTSGRGVSSAGLPSMRNELLTHRSFSSGRQFDAPTATTPGSVANCSRMSWWRESNPERQGRSRIEARIDGAQILKTADHQTRCDEEDERKRDLCTDQQMANAKARAGAGTA